MSITEKKNNKKGKQSCGFKKVIRPQQDEVSIKFKYEQPAVRYLKLHPFYRQTGISANRIVPGLKLCGCWLRDAGFNPDEYVSVTIMNGLLIIKLAVL